MRAKNRLFNPGIDDFSEGTIKHHLITYVSTEKQTKLTLLINTVRTIISIGKPIFPLESLNSNNIILKSNKIRTYVSTGTTPKINAVKCHFLPEIDNSKILRLNTL